MQFRVPFCIENRNFVVSFVRRECIECMPGEYEICIDNTVRPVVHAPRKLPLAIKENLRNKLNEMEQRQIIAKVDGPTD